MPSLPRLIALTSTCPRWVGDPQPDFVLNLCQSLQPWFRVTLLAPHAAGARMQEAISGVEVRRFRYAPDRLERLAYESGMVGNLRARPWLLALLPSFFWAQARALRQLVNAGEGPVVVHAHWLFPQGWLAGWVLARAGVPVVVTAHGSDVLALRGSFWDGLHRRTMSRVRAVTVVGPELRERLSELGYREPIPVLPMGVDTNFFAPDNVPRSAEQILVVGRLVEEKGVAVLLRALAELRQDGRRVRLVIAGEGPEREKLVQLAKTLCLSDQIELTGWLGRESLRDRYRSTACCIFPSLREGFGLALIEALACGAPVLASDLPAFRYIDGGAGVIRFFETGNAEDLARHLAALLDSRTVRESMESAGVRRAQEFSAKAAAAGYAEVLQRAIGVSGS